MIRVSAGVFAPEASLLDVCLAASPCGLRWSSLCASESLMSLPLLPGTRPVGFGPHSTTSFNLNYLLKHCVPNTVTQGVRTSAQQSRGHNSAHSRRGIESRCLLLCEPFTM